MFCVSTRAVCSVESYNLAVNTAGTTTAPNISLMTRKFRLGMVMGTAPNGVRGRTLTLASHAGRSIEYHKCHYNEQF